MKYQVVVGNIGTVYDGPLLKEAMENYRHYREQSESLGGRAGGEDVTLFEDGDIKWEFTGQNTLDDAAAEMAAE